MVMQIAKRNKKKKIEHEIVKCYNSFVRNFFFHHRKIKVIRQIHLYKYIGLHANLHASVILLRNIRQCLKNIQSYVFLFLLFIYLSIHLTLTSWV